MRIGIVGRGEKPERLKVARRAARHIGDRAEVVASPTMAGEIGLDGVEVREMEVDAVVTVGGDGSILYTLQRTAAPVCGINMGDMGFLTTAEPEDLEPALDRLLEGDYEVDERTRLTPRHGGEELPPATNEVALKSPSPSQTLEVRVDVGGDLAARFAGDGVVVATPTGSTAYSLSAGGPLVHPSVEGILVVPLASLDPSSRPLVVPVDEAVELAIPREGGRGVFAVDGQQERTLRPGGELVCTRADVPGRLVSFGRSFYDRLRHQLL